MTFLRALAKYLIVLASALAAVVAVATMLALAGFVSIPGLLLTAGLMGLAVVAVGWGLKDPIKVIYLALCCSSLASATLIGLVFARAEAAKVLLRADVQSGWVGGVEYWVCVAATVVILAGGGALIVSKREVINASD